ncbi:MAG: DinB family protein [bacterium]
MPMPADLAPSIGRAFTGPAWHGDAIAELLADVAAAEAAARPFDDVHTIAELVGHIGAWVAVAERRLGGETGSPSEDDVWPEVDTSSDRGWVAAVRQALEKHRSLMRAAAAADERLLREKLPGRDHDAETMLRGIVEHDAYHGGQIAMLKKVIRAKARAG